MKKYILMGAAVSMVLAFTSCKSSESAYKKAYEKAQAAQQTTQQTQEDLVPVETTPVQTQVSTPVQTQTTTPQEDYSNVSVRTEDVSFVSGNALKTYSVVVGSFGVQSNATALANKLNGEGYSTSIVKANVNGMDYYRVIAGSSDNKGTAAVLRNSLGKRFNGAWLLYQK